jgi:hypothetical protein
MEFRARTGGFLGHTFVVYGRTDDRGRPLDQNQAGIYPVGEFSESPILPLLFVPGDVTYKREDPKDTLTALYRRRLNAAQFAHLKAVVRRLHARRTVWQFVFYNCNSFAAEVARNMGFTTPSTLDVPRNFVDGLRILNGP